ETLGRKYRKGEDEKVVPLPSQRERLGEGAQPSDCKVNEAKTGCPHPPSPAAAGEERFSTFVPLPSQRERLGEGARAFAGNDIETETRCPHPPSPAAAGEEPSGPSRASPV